MRKNGDKLQKLGATVVVVQREDKLRAEGLKRTADKTKVPFVLLDDLDSRATLQYSKGSFATYVIDSRGFIRFILNGTKTKRPDAAKILARLGELSKKE